MPDALLLDLSGLAALLVLLLLPGLLVVRAPWPAVPFLSLSFWMLSWWWLSRVAPERQHFVQVALACFAGVLLLRLLRPQPVSRPAWPTLLVCLASLARLSPFFLWPVAPGAPSSRQAMLALLLTWRDGIPASFEPLLPLSGYSVPSGFASLAADITLLSGLPPHRSALLASCAALGLLQIAWYALLRRLFPAAAAAVASLLALGLSALPQGLFTDGACPGLLALALLTAAASVLARAASRSRAVAAGWLLAGGLACDPHLAGMALLGLPLLLLDRPGQLERLLIAGSTAALASAPLLLSVRADSLTQPGETALGAPYLLACGLGLATALRQRTRGILPLLALASLLLVLAQAFSAAAAAALAAVLLSIGMAHLIATGLAPGTARAGLLAGLGALAVFRLGRSYQAAASALEVGPDDLRAMRFLTTHARPLDVVCNQPGAGAWIPAVAGLGNTVPYLEPEEAAGFHPRPCAYRYLPRPAEGAIFSSGSVSILESAR